jgi:ketosteroid isomerase-like protein
MSEKTARWTTTLDGIPNEHSGGTYYLRRSVRRASHPFHDARSQYCGKSQCSSSFPGGTHMKVHRAVAGAWILMACADLAGCSSSDGRLPPAVTTEVARDFNEGDALRTAADYTDDAQILAPQHPAIQGKAAIVAFFKANIDKYLGFGNETTWSLVRGDVAIEQGVYSVRNVRIGENVEAGKYIRIWKRTNNGTWKLYRDMYSSDSEAPAAVSVSPGEAPS